MITPSEAAQRSLEVTTNELHVVQNAVIVFNTLTLFVILLPQGGDTLTVSSVLRWHPHHSGA
jgi:hypothetical protein